MSTHMSIIDSINWGVTFYPDKIVIMNRDKFIEDIQDLKTDSLDITKIRDILRDFHNNPSKQTGYATISLIEEVLDKELGEDE